MNLVEQEALNFDIDITAQQDFPNAEFRVTVHNENSSHTTHTVRVEEEHWEELTGGKMSAQDLVRATFEFLLQRESNEAILQDFNLRQVAEYFPDFENVIKRVY